MRLWPTLSLMVLTACGATSGGPSPPSVVNPGSTVSFSPSEVDAQRFAGTCLVGGVPPYSDADLFAMYAVGAQDPVPRTLIEVVTKRAVAVGSPYALVVSSAYVATGSAGATQAQSASSADGLVQLSFGWGANAAEIDPSPLDAVTVTIDAFPAQDGAALTVHCVFHFTDGQTLDITFSADTVPPPSGCPAG
jgi:hypothetical protein